VNHGLNKSFNEYRFVIFYRTGAILISNPVKVKVETRYIRLQEEEPVLPNAEVIMVLHYCLHKLDRGEGYDRFVD